VDFRGTAMMGASRTRHQPKPTQASQEPAMQTRLATLSQYPAFVASVSFLGVIFFYVAAGCAFA
jgi:hypothetical protein